MRVIAGTVRGRKLETPLGMDTRPTTDRIKETLFNMLQFDLPGCNFLDLFSGSGQIAIEALSRGANKAVLVENDKNAAGIIQANLEKTGFAEQASLIKQDVFVALQTLEYKDKFDFIFMDPPYNQELEKRVLEYLTMSSLVDSDTMIIFEASLETDISYLDQLGYDLIKDKRYKTNKHIFVQRKAQ